MIISISIEVVIQDGNYLSFQVKNHQPSPHRWGVLVDLYKALYSAKAFFACLSLSMSFQPCKVEVSETLGNPTGARTEYFRLCCATSYSAHTLVHGCHPNRCISMDNFLFGEGEAKVYIIALFRGGWGRCKKT